MPTLKSVLETNIVVVGITGKAGVGKSTLAKYLADRYGFTRLSFASPIKKMLSVLVDNCFGITMKDMPIDDLCGRSLRYGLQTLGTEWGRNMIGEDVWVNYMNRYISICMPLGYNRFVIDDVRFDNEARFVQSFRDDGYGLVVKVVSDTRVLSAHDSHVSESGISSELVDWVIHNNLSVDSMCESMEHILNIDINDVMRRDL